MEIKQEQEPQPPATPAPNLGVAIPLTKGKTAIVDPEDAIKVIAYKWHAKQGSGHGNTQVWYARRNIYIPGQPRRAEFMHTLITGWRIKENGLRADHINGNGLDNRRQNLRPATNRQNCRNMVKYEGTSKFKGVHWNKRREKWCSQIMLGDLRKFNGYYDIESAAAEAYNQAAILYFGEYARINDLDNPGQTISVATLNKNENKNFNPEQLNNHELAALHST